ncbi:hypothetical protein ATCC90586_005602 [Pythium insidiosum]|nr:hypothetical protein ATCC90586_005602 [Pythium insidiosum]
MVLTEKQRQDLHQSMLDYLVAMGERFADTAAAFEREAGITQSHDGKHADMLEKKWTSVLRLQKKVMELESKIKQLEESNKLGGIVSRRDVLGGGRSRAEFLPRAPCKYSLSGHRNPITCVAFHPVFSVFVSGSEDATIKVWDFETGEYERTLKGHTNQVQKVAFNVSGTMLASTSADLTIKLWDFSSDGDYECLKTLRGHDHNVCGLVFSPLADSDRLYSCSRDHTIKVWEISTGYCLHTMNNGHADWVRDINVSDDGLYLASCGNDRSILFWDLQHHRVLQSLREHDHVVESVVFAKSGTQEQAIEKFHTQKLVATNSHENWVRCVRFHPCGRYAVSVAEDRTIRVHDIETGRCVRTVDQAHEHFLTSLDIHATLPLMITGSIDKHINVWECA